ncbi:MAG: hypothetical protein ACRDCT_03995, partial [Shewanella sp.]
PARSAAASPPFGEQKPKKLAPCPHPPAVGGPLNPANANGPNSETKSRSRLFFFFPESLAQYQGIRVLAVGKKFQTAQITPSPPKWGLKFFSGFSKKFQNLAGQCSAAYESLLFKKNHNKLGHEGNIRSKLQPSTPTPSSLILPLFFPIRKVF